MLVTNYGSIFNYHFRGPDGVNHPIKAPINAAHKIKQKLLIYKTPNHDILSSSEKTCTVKIGIFSSLSEYVL